MMIDRRFFIGGSLALGASACIPPDQSPLGRLAAELRLIEAVGNGNAKGEYYLTDIVEIARKRGLSCVALTAPESEVQGVNDRVQLADAALRLNAMIVRGWQLGPSRILPPTCRYAPSCSQYAIEALGKYGAIKGGWMAAKRIMRCHPWGGHGFDPVP